MASRTGNASLLQQLCDGAERKSSWCRDIFRGGDTWHFGNSSASPYAGGNSFGLPGGGGTSAYPIYFGVDQSWYSGGSWARPIFTEDNPPSTSQKLSSCTFPTGSDLINFGGGKYFIVDNLELTGACTTSAYWNFTYVNYGSLSGYANFYNLYIHGWSHVGFPNPNNCTNSSTCMSAFRGGVNTLPQEKPFSMTLWTARTPTQFRWSSVTAGHGE